MKSSKQDGLTRQARWTRRQIESRGCIRCGKAIETGNRTQRCGPCRQLHNMEQQSIRQAGRAVRSRGIEHGREVPEVRSLHHVVRPREASGVKPKGRGGRKVLVAMARVGRAAAMLWLCASLVTPAISDTQMGPLLYAIWRAEGGHRAANPYGIRSKRKLAHHEARAIAIRTIENAHIDWNLDGRPGRFIHYLGRKWCPPASDPSGHRNWIKNVTSIYDASTTQRRATGGRP